MHLFSCVLFWEGVSKQERGNLSASLSNISLCDTHNKNCFLDLPV